MIELLISGPGKNSLSSALLQSLTAQIRNASGEPLLLTGEGDAFCAGLDLKEVASLDAAGMEVFLRRLEALLEALYFYPGPTVSFVNGHAIAGGCLLALFCDYRVAMYNPKTKIGLNEVALGLQFPPRVLQMVRRLLSPREAERVVLEAGLHSPDAARALGLIDEVVGARSAEEARQLGLTDNRSFIDAAKEKLAARSKLPREAYAASKRALRALPAADEASQKFFVEQVVPVWVSPELKKKLLAVLGK